MAYSRRHRFLKNVIFSYYIKPFMARKKWAQFFAIEGAKTGTYLILDLQNAYLAVASFINR